MSTARTFTHGLVATAPMSGANWFPGSGLNAHRTEDVTKDHQREAANDDKALAYLHRMGALDLADMLFAPMRPQYVSADGKRVHR